MANTMDAVKRATAGDTDYFKDVELDVIQKSKDIDGDSVLSVSALYGHLSCCEVIYRRCPQLLYETSNNRATALHHSAYKGRDEITKFLLTAREKLEQEEKGVKSGGEEIVDHRLLMMLNFAEGTALHSAMVRGRLGSAKILVEADPSNTLLRMVDIDKETALHRAVKYQHLEIVKLLVDTDLDFVYSANVAGKTPLSIALEEAFSGDQKAVEIRNFLIQRQSSQCAVRIGAEGWTILHHATFKGDLSAIEEIIRSNPDCSELSDNEGRNFLHLATKFEHKNVVKYVLGLENISYNVLNGQDINGDTPLHIATTKANVGIALSLLYDHRVNKLIQNNQEENALAAIRFDYDTRRAWFFCLIESVDEKELKDGSDFDLLVGALISTVSFTAAEIRRILIEKQPAQCRLHTGNNEWTLLHYATQKGDLRFIKEIIHFSPDCCELVDREGQHFLHLAVLSGQVNVVQYILGLTEIADNILNGQDIYGNTPLHIAMSTGNESIALALLDDSRVNKMAENMEGKTAFDVAAITLLEALSKSMYLIQCASKGDVEFFRAVQVDVFRNFTNEDGESVLSISVMNGHSNCYEVISKRCPKLLYQANKYKVSCLHTAVSNGDTEIVKSLIEADPTKKLLRMTDNHKETSMHYAVKKHNFDIVKLLVEADCNFEYSVNESGETPLSIALQEAFSREPIPVQIRVLLIQKQPSQCKTRTGKNGWTLLQHATSAGDLSAIGEIIQFCPDCLPLVDREGQNFLHLAVSSTHANVVNYILGFPDLSDSVLNGKDSHGETPLHIATRMGSVSIALSLLYDRRVRKTILNKNGKSALEAIRFDYDKRKAGVLGDVMDEKDIKDRSEFDLLVGALISTVSFTAGITVPGGFNSDGGSKGMAILHKKGAFVAFVASNTIALALSLFAVFIHFCVKHLVDDKEITFQLKVATVCSIGSIFAMMVAFIMGSLAVLSNSLVLILIVCGICSVFFGFAFYFLWRMRTQQRRRRPV